MQDDKLTNEQNGGLKPSWFVFENTVGDLLSLSGYKVEREQLSVHKKVDLIASREELGKTRVYAVECKDHSNRVGKRALCIIEADYRPLYEKHVIDALLLITRNGLTPAAEAMIQASRLIHHRTLDQLKTSLLDVSRYLKDIVSRYHEEGLHAYYIPTRGVLPESCYEHADLDSEIAEWIKQTDAPPIALLGSYGSGKSTFMLHLANE